jgi:hypothetical protein
MAECPSYRHSAARATKRGLSLVPSQKEIGIPPGRDVSYFRLTLILGFNFHFK